VPRKLCLADVSPLAGKGAGRRCQARRVEAALAPILGVARGKRTPYKGGPARRPRAGLLPRAAGLERSGRPW